MIVRYTSDCIQLVLKRFAPVLQNGKSLYFRLVDHIDIKVFFGILYLRSAFHSNMRNIRDLRFHESAHDIFAAAMSWNRFHFICKFITLMISQHATIDGKMTNMHAWENCSKKWICKMQNAGFPRHYLPLMKPCIHTVVQSASNSTTPTSFRRMDYYTSTYVICQPGTPSSHCHMLVNLRRLLEKQRSFMSPELTSILSI